MMIRRTLALLWLTIGLLATVGCRPPNTSQDALRQLAPQLPVTRVTLYQNGVGYFEREGKVKGDVLTLHCRPSQINDLLKSLTVIDRGSGRAVSVSLPLDKASVRALAELPRQVRRASGLLDVLNVFRGARVRLEGGRGKATGRVLGVEKGLVGDGGGDKPVMGWRVTLKSDAGDLVVYPISQVERLVMLDRALEVGLEKSLDVSLSEGSWKPITLSVRLSDPGAHDLMVSYIVEMPNWKPAYRLVLPKGRKPLLQGWAVVDNVSGENWRKVRLSLVAGTPMSFIYDLHRPRFTRRLDLTPRGLTRALAPTRDAPGDLGGDDDRKESLADKAASKSKLERGYARSRRSRRGYRRPRAPAKRRPDLRLGSVAAPMALNRLLEKKVRTRVKGKQVGSLFSYDLQDRVTVPDSSSTLVNIVNARVPGAQVVLFRPAQTRSYGASHPYSAVRFANKTGFALEKGPVTIYAGGTFVGEGFLERMEKGQTVFLTFAIDGNVSMTRSTGNTQKPVRLLKIHHGQIVSEVLNIRRTTYRVTNRHDHPVVAYFKSRKRPGYSLKNAPKQTVYAGNWAYIPVTVKAKGKAEHVVEWVSPMQRHFAVDSSLAKTILQLYLGTADVPASIRPTLQKILKAKERVGEIRIEQARLSRMRDRLSSDQRRVRDNLKLLRKVKGQARLKAQLTRSLAELEGRLSKLTAKHVKLDEERARLKREMRALIAAITLKKTK